MSSQSRRVIRKREFGPRGRNFAKTGRTIDRWIKAGKFPRPDLVLPGNEKAWYEDTIDSWEQSRSAATMGGGS